MPTQTVNQDGSVIAKRIEKEVATFGDIMWGALGQKSANPKKRTEMVAAAFDNFRSFLGKALTSAGTQKIVKPGGSTVTAGKKGDSTMSVADKLKSDIEITKRRLQKLQAELGSGSSIPTKPAAPTTKAALQEQLAALFDDVKSLREDVAKMTERVNEAALQSEFKKAFGADSTKPWDGVFTRKQEREQVILKVAKAAQASRQPANWNGVWTGRA